jgi:hypothetical protein
MVEELTAIVEEDGGQGGPIRNGGLVAIGDGVHLRSKGSITSHNSSGSKSLAMIVISRRKFPKEAWAIIVPSYQSC